MESIDLHEFASDRPITRIEDDLLGRSGFSNDLADAMSSWHGEDSLVVSLHGDWGSGKSSIKNMAISRLEDIKKNKPNVIEFSPWEWAAQEKITASFFQEISKSVGRKDKSKAGKKLAAALEKYGSYLNTGGLVVSGFSAVLPALFMCSILIGFGGNFFDEAWVRTLNTVLLAGLGLGAVILKWGKSFFNSLSGNIKAIAKEKEQSLSDIRQELTNLLSARKSPLIVVMDDLDRLTSDQLRMVFQLIKANSEFPNVVFFLLFQRDLVEDKLKDCKQSGRDYLEKIIQVPFDIPKIEATRIRSLLLEKLAKIIEQDESAAKMFDSGRWENIFYGALYAYFDNLRDVCRYTSTLSFHFTLLKGKVAFEVDPVDLIAIECLRIFEPDIYKEIARSKNIFTRNGLDIRDRSRDSTTALINEILDKASANKKDLVKELVKQLFPTVEWSLSVGGGGGQYSSDFANGWLREMRICHPSNFDKYFQFSIPSDELSNSDLQEMLASTSDAEKFSLFILSLKARGILSSALSQFESFIDKVPLTNGSAYIKGILDVGDQVDNESAGLTAFSLSVCVVRLVVWFLRRIEDKKERGDLLLDCFKLSRGISVVGNILRSDEERREKSDTDLTLRDEEFDLIKAEIVKKLDNMFAGSSEELMAHKHLVHFLYKWKRWGGEDKVTSWFGSQVASVDGCINLLIAFVNESYSSAVGAYGTKVTTYIKLENIEDFVEIDSLRKIINDVNTADLSDRAKEAVNAFNEALERREKGISDHW